MTWFKVDDKLHEHRKVRKAGKAAMGVWLVAGSWCMDNDSDGFVPDDVLLRWGTVSDAGKLVAAGFWFVDQQAGEKGWRFHDWDHYQPSAAVTAAKREAERESGIRGNHKRWHVARKISDPDCIYCYRVPDQVPDGDPDRVGSGGGDSGAIPPVPVPVPVTSPNGEGRLDVERICQHLADRIEANGSKRPAIGKAWKDAARLLMDRDSRPESELHLAIDWCQDNDFWRSNILSMPKFREKFDQMRLQAERESNVRHLPGGQGPDDWMRRRL